MDNYIGKKLEGRYLITELIGIGGMANVYKATDVTDGKTVAVKILREEFYGNEEFMRRFKNESKAIAVLSHPNIIKVYDVCFSNRMQSIVMEYVDGITLKEYMEQQKVLSWKETVHFVVQILWALSHAHDRGIVHRDIKPQNVMLLADGTIKITDFGIARFARSETKTLTDRAIGSVHYISPEQARGEHTDQRSDIYSVGVMMYEMLTGKLPFDAENPVSVALKQIQLEAPSPRSLNPDIPEALEEITLRAMQKDPDLRYQSAAEMLNDISAFRRDPSVRFEYQYLTDSSVEEQRYRRAVQSARRTGESEKKKMSSRTEGRTPRKPAAGTSPRRGLASGGRRHAAPSSQEEARRPREKSSGSPVIAALFGITAAFVVITMVFVGAMLYFNNPLEKVPDVVVPKLDGLRYDEVRASAQYGDFTFEIEETKYDETERGLIISQKPKAGTKAKTGSTIKVVVSNGQKEVSMPYLIGYEETSAYAELVALDLDYEKVEVYSNQTVGTVVATDPAYGTEVPAGTVVSVQISIGPENRMIAVPDLTGHVFGEAYQQLLDMGFTVGSVSYVASGETAGTVLHLSPEPGTELMSGSAVDMTISSGSTESTNQVTLNIPLPADVNEYVTFKAVYSGEVISTTQLNPSAAGYWRPSFQGTGKVEIFILYNDFLYQTYEIDFSEGSYTLTEDNSAQHG